MTWTCTKCQNENPELKAECLHCNGADKPAGLSEDERAAKKPAASTHGEVSTPNLNECVANADCWFPALQTAVESDIRSAVERATERHQVEMAGMEGRLDGQRKVSQALREHDELMRKERDEAIEEIRKDKARIAELDELMRAKERDRAEWADAAQRWQVERDAAPAEVKQLKAERDTYRSYAQELQSRHLRNEAEIERLNMRVENVVETCDLYQAEIQDLRAKLEATEKLSEQRRLQIFDLNMAKDAKRCQADRMPRAEVLAFALVMEEKLKTNDHKNHWSNCDVGWLFDRLLAEAAEVKSEIMNINRDRVKMARECADVANFAMMIADNCAGLNETKARELFTPSEGAQPQGGNEGKR